MFILRRTIYVYGNVCFTLHLSMKLVFVNIRQLTSSYCTNVTSSLIFFVNVTCNVKIFIFNTTKLNLLARGTCSLGS